MKSALLIFTAITFFGCSSYEPRTYRITTITKSCPKDYFYNMYDGMCYYFVLPKLSDHSLSPELEVKRPQTIKVSKKHLKRLRMAKKDESESVSCVKAIAKTKECGYAL